MVNGVDPVAEETPNGVAPPVPLQPDGAGKLSGTEDKDLSHAIDASRRYAANMSSPRKLPENRFHNILKQLNRTESADSDSNQDAQSTAGSREIKRSTIRKQPRKISSMLAVNGAQGNNRIE